MAVLHSDRKKKIASLNRIEFTADGSIRWNFFFFIQVIRIFRGISMPRMVRQNALKKRG